MYPVSAAYKEAIKQNVRDVRITGTITLKDESIINITDADIVQGSLYFTEQCVSGEDIEVGNVYASELGLTLTSPPENPYSLDGARIIINFGINVEPDPEEDPLWEYVPLGYFYVTEIERKQTTVNLKALDGMILFDVDLSGVLTTGTPYSLIQSCCTKAGVTLATSSGEFAAFANGLSTFTIPDESKIETCRDLIMWVCQITGTFARMNRMGQLEIIPVTAGASVKTISKPERFTSDVSDFYVKITKVTMKVGEEEYSQGTDGMTLVLEENPLLAGKSEAEINAALAEILDQVTLAEYTPYNLGFAGDPALQAGDWVTLKDTGTLGGGDVVSIITHTTWRYRGPHEIRAVGKSGLLRGVQAQQSKTVSSIRAIAKAAQDLAQAANQSTQLIKDAIGGHVLIRREPGGTNEILIMDNPDPEQAVKIWRWNMGGLGYSDNVVGADNPDREYTVAMTMDGAINADFIKTGKLIADVVQIGPETTFEEGYDPFQTNQALKSLADGTYTGGTFIDGTRIIAPEINAGKVLGLYGSFLDILIGDPEGARMQIAPRKPLEPYLPISGWWDGWSGIIASGHSISNLQRPMYAFDGDTSTYWYHDVDDAGEEGTWIGMEYRTRFTKYCLKRIRVYSLWRNYVVSLQCSDGPFEGDITGWITVDENLQLLGDQWVEIDVNENDIFAYAWRLHFGKVSAAIPEIEFYGVPYEPSFAGLNRNNERIYEFSDDGLRIFNDRFFMDNNQAAVIIDQGSNGNGSYVRWSNGLQVCWQTTTAVFSNSARSADINWTFPVAFKSPPFVDANSYNAATYLIKAGYYGGVSAAAVSRIAFGDYSAPVTRTNPVALFAIGWWK